MQRRDLDVIIQTKYPHTHTCHRCERGLSGPQAMTLENFAPLLLAPLADTHFFLVT